MTCIVSDADADQLFRGSVCQYEDSLYAIIGVNGDGKLSAMNILTDDMENIPQDADKITCPTNWQLGYLQLDSVARYMERVPARQYKVGWTRGTIPDFPSVDRLVGVKKYRDAFRKMVQGEYPTFAATIGHSAGDRRVAFERQWAIQNGTELMYRGHRVGLVVGGEIHLSDGWKFLQQSLEVLV